MPTTTLFSIETAKQKLEKDRLRREAELKIAEKQKKLAELRKIYNKVLIDNQNLPEHVRLKPEVQWHTHLDHLLSLFIQHYSLHDTHSVCEDCVWTDTFILRGMLEELREKCHRHLVMLLTQQKHGEPMCLCVVFKVRVRHITVKGWVTTRGINKSIPLVSVGWYVFLCVRVDVFVHAGAAAAPMFQ